ncbi:Crp/Fnr family transcriptional regulator [Alteribacillus sp. YIM 98480]|uniref:Crp/Fnr family transcriptional regulator n=1 Tax=Alteribacillus sp. YIM 98480 TaxID=2606599 RepID=UPI00131BC955|nr:Crp/Fnr family transcriptional regulator [Alteribacillus sp. YIM 98480]
MTVLVSNSGKLNEKEFVTYGKRTFIKKNTVIYQQGEVGDSIYYVEKGLVKVTTKTANGDDLLLKISLPGQFLGVQTMDQLVHYTTSQTINDSVLYLFNYDTVKELLLAHPELSRLFLKVVINELNILTEKICLSKLPSEQKIAKLLLNIYHEFNQFDIRLTRNELAKCTGVTRITIYKIMKEWEENSYIETLGRSIVIRNPSALQFYADGLFAEE